MAASFWSAGLADFWTTGFLPYIACFTVVYIVFAFILYAVVRMCPRLILSRKSIKSNTKRVLLVISHPDDECMFFGPTALALLRECKSHFYLMCLSKGDYNGKGNVRKQELWNSCTTLGILPDNISLINHDFLRDDPRADWSPDIVGKLILSHIASHHIDTLITFDQYGVSGHKNHKALYFSIRELAKQKKIPEYCTPYVLESVNIFRKYMPTMLDVPLSLIMSSVVYVADWKQYSLLRAAMSQHTSQAVWFRFLYLFFSRYLTLNTLHHITTEGSSRSKKTN